MHAQCMQCAQHLRCMPSACAMLSVSAMRSVPATRAQRLHHKFSICNACSVPATCAQCLQRMLSACNACLVPATCAQCMQRVLSACEACSGSPQRALGSPAAPRTGEQPPAQLLGVGLVPPRAAHAPGLMLRSEPHPALGLGLCQRRSPRMPRCPGPHERKTGGSLPPHPGSLGKGWAGSSRPRGTGSCRDAVGMLSTPCPNGEGAKGPGRIAAAPLLHRAGACSAMEEAQPRARLSGAGWMEPTYTSPLYIELRRRAPCDTLHRQSD